MTTFAKVPRIRWFWWVAAAAVVVMAGGALAVVSALALDANAPRIAVAHYLSALEKGHASQALAMTGSKAGPSDLLLTDKAFHNATKRITRFSLGRVSTAGDTATVDATIEQGGHKYSQAFQLTRTGRDLATISHWRLRPPALTRIAIAFTGPGPLQFTIVGQNFSSAPDVEFRAFPGTYNVLPEFPSRMYYAPPFTVTAVGFGNAEPKPADMAIDLSSEGESAAEQAVNEFMDKCAASTELVPAGCPFRAVGQAGVTVDSATWSLDTRPEFSVGGYTSRGWPVVSTTVGSAKMSGTAHDGSGRSGEVHTPEIPFGLVGFVTFDGDTATYAQFVK